MNNKKKSGSFYTPKIVADYFVKYLVQKLEAIPTITILEPSAGDGVFVNSVYKNISISSKIEKLIAVEKDKTEIDKISEANTQETLSLIHADFLDYQLNNLERYSLVIGNPPYIKKSLLSEDQIEKCRKIHANANLKTRQPKNIWTAFLVRCIEFTDFQGVLAFVLPSDLLQVKYASEIRNLLLKEFERIEII